MKRNTHIFRSLLLMSSLFFIVCNGFAQQQQGRSDFAFPDGTILSSENGTIRAELYMSSKPYDEGIVGVFSDNSKSVNNAMVKSNPVVSGGITNVRCNAEGGNIKKGDLITSSSEPGVAMKAVHSGIIIGIALEDAGERGIVKARILIQYVK